LATVPESGRDEDENGDQKSSWQHINSPGERSPRPEKRPRSRHIGGHYITNGARESNRDIKHP
jgi:hypothetical protein